jgi:hypothetical protein
VERRDAVEGIGADLGLQKLNLGLGAAPPEFPIQIDPGFACRVKPSTSSK